MKRLFTMLLAVVVLGTAVMFSSARLDPSSVSDSKSIQIQSEKQNPWTGLTVNDSPDTYHFAVVADRTGGHRKGIFSKAVQQVNLMQPAFVMSVGDLIEGSRQAEVNRKQWDEFDSYTKQFQMPFFYVTGNHDAASKAQADVWKERYGRRFYHFVYKNTLFLMLNQFDEEGLNADEDGSYRRARIGKTQQEYIDKVLKDNPKVRWTFVFMHQPMWAHRDLTENGWMEVEKMLTGRNYSVFVGHVHLFRKYIRNNMNYYQLATTGGGSSLRGLEYGEFDQIAWVTMKQDQPIIAQVLLSGIHKEDLTPIVTDEDGGVAAIGKKQNLVTGKVTLAGKPAFGLSVIFTQIVEGDTKNPLVGNARVGVDGSFTIYSGRGSVGLPAGRYVVTFAPADPLVIDPNSKKDNPVPEKYRTFTTTPYKVDVKEGNNNEFEFVLE